MGVPVTGVVVRPVHQPAKIVPLIHTAKLDAIAHAQRHPLGEVDVVDDQQRIAACEPQDKALVTRPIVIV